MYSERLIDHFMNPRNAGSMQHPDGVGIIGHPGCGDYVKVYLRMDGLIIQDIKFEVFGCPASIGTMSALSEMVKGKSLTYANTITDQMVEEAVGGLTEVKKHCSNLAVSAFQEAVIDYLTKQVGDEEVEEVSKP